VRQIVGRVETRRASGALPLTRTGNTLARGIALAAFAAVALTGCGSGGFQPLYGTASLGQNAEKLAGVDIGHIPGRVGQRIRNELVFDKTAAQGATTQPTKRVEVKLTESLITTLADLKGDSSGQTYQVEAVYRIVDVASAKVESEGRSIARANFERFESIYANVRGRQEAEDRAARQIANDLKTRIAVHLSRG
jgi:LPS-assembly lipoprotein